MLLVAPCRRVHLVHLPGRFLKGQDRLRHASCLQGIAARARKLAVLEGRAARFSKAHERRAAQAKLAALSPDDDPLNPLLRSGRLHPKVQAVSVKVLARFLDVLNKPSVERSLRPAHAGSRHAIPHLVPQQVGDTAGLCRIMTDVGSQKYHVSSVCYRSQAEVGGHLIGGPRLHQIFTPQVQGFGCRCAHGPMIARRCGFHRSDHPWPGRQAATPPAIRHRQP